MWDNTPASSCSRSSIDSDHVRGGGKCRDCPWPASTSRIAPASAVGSAGGISRIVSAVADLRNAADAGRHAWERACECLAKDVRHPLGMARQDEYVGCPVPVGQLVLRLRSEQDHPVAKSQTVDASLERLGERTEADDATPEPIAGRGQEAAGVDQHIDAFDRQQVPHEQDHGIAVRLKYLRGDGRPVSGLGGTWWDRLRRKSRGPCRSPPPLRSRAGPGRG